MADFRGPAFEVCVCPLECKSQLAQTCSLSCDEIIDTDNIEGTLRTKLVKYSCFGTRSVKSTALQAGRCLPDSIFNGWSALGTLVLSDVRLAATCFAQCQLPGLHTLSLTDVHISTQLAASVAKASLPKLHTLNIANQTLTVPSLQQLAKGQWPDLRCLVIDKDLFALSRDERLYQRDTTVDPLEGSDWPLLENLSADGWNIHLLAASKQCRWPNLKILAASYVNCLSGCLLAKLEDISLAQVSQPDFLARLLKMQLPALHSLQILTLNKFGSPRSLWDLVCRANWPKLADLRLPYHDLGLGSLSSVRQADWCLLSNLDLGSNRLRPEAMSHLAACAWPCLRRLVLTRNGLDHQAIHHLVCGHWPKLQILDLGDNNLGHTAMQQLVRGEWPLLWWLDLTRNTLNMLALQTLLQGRWPRLERLCLDVSRVDVLTLQDDADCSEDCLFADLLVEGFNGTQSSSDDDGDSIEGHDDGVSSRIISNTAVRSVRFELPQYLF